MKRRLPSIILVGALAPLLLLQACSKSSAPQAAPTAGGEILPGSVTDAMLDTDQSQSQAPLAPAAHSAAPKADASTAVEQSEAAGEPGNTADGAPADQPSPRPTVTTASKTTTP